MAQQTEAQFSGDLSEQDFARALQDVGSFIDVTVGDLLELYRLARKYAQIRHVESVLVREVMRAQVVVVGPDQSLAEAARLLLVHGIGGMPVVDETDRLVGVLTEADLLAAIGLPCHHSACGLWHKLEHLFGDHRQIRGLAGQVRDVMIDDPVVIAEDETLQTAIERMRKRRVKRLIVVDAETRVTGMVTRSTIVRAFLEAEGTPLP